MLRRFLSPFEIRTKVESGAVPVAYCFCVFEGLLVPWVCNMSGGGTQVLSPRGVDQDSGENCMRKEDPFCSTSQATSTCLRRAYPQAETLLFAPLLHTPSSQYGKDKRQTRRIIPCTSPPNSLRVREKCGGKVGNDQEKTSNSVRAKW